MNDFCGICGKRLNVLNRAYGHQTKEHSPICLGCYKKGFLSREERDNDIKREKAQNAKVEQFKNNPVVQRKPTERKDYVYEYKRTCNECGKIWYSLQSREKKLENEQCWNSCFTCGSVGNMAAYNQARRNEQSTRDNLNDLHQCPNCHSTNYKELLIRHEKQ